MPFCEKQRELNTGLFVQYFYVKGIEAKVIALPTQEANKDFELVYEIAHQLEEFGLNRSGISVGFNVYKSKASELPLCIASAQILHCMARHHRSSSSWLLKQAKGAHHCNWWRCLLGHCRTYCKPFPTKHANYQGEPPASTSFLGLCRTVESEGQHCDSQIVLTVHPSSRV